MVFQNMNSFAKWDQAGSRRDPHGSAADDVAQLCGGSGDTASLLVTRGWESETNVDIIVGFNLREPDVKAAFLEYLNKRKPKILIISTPCTGRKGFSALNRRIHYPAWIRSRRLSVPLANLAGWAALSQ